MMILSYDHFYNLKSVPHALTYYSIFSWIIYNFFHVHCTLEECDDIGAQKYLAKIY